MGVSSYGRDFLAVQALLLVFTRGDVLFIKERWQGCVVGVERLAVITPPILND